MHENSEILMNLCTDYVCKKIKELLGSTHINTTDTNLSVFGLMCNKESICLPKKISEDLLTKLSEQNKLNDETLALFNYRNDFLK